MSTKPIIVVPTYEICLLFKHVILLFLFLFGLAVLGYLSGCIYEIERYIHAENTSDTKLY
jgi:hypothetical protein